MADRVLRDQCDHGHYERHAVLNHQGVMADSCPGGREVTLTGVTVVFDGPPGPEPGRFIEVENPETGESIKLGEWYEIDGLWYLAFDAALGDTE